MGDNSMIGMLDKMISNSGNTCIWKRTGYKDYAVFVWARIFPIIDWDFILREYRKI